jgi:hypothetical protein
MPIIFMKNAVKVQPFSNRSQGHADQMACIQRGLRCIFMPYVSKEEFEFRKSMTVTIRELK